MRLRRVVTDSGIMIFCFGADHADLRISLRIMRFRGRVPAESERSAAHRMPEVRQAHVRASSSSAAGFQLKGSGWYVTDFKNKGAKPAAGKDKPAAEAEVRQPASPTSPPQRQQVRHGQTDGDQEGSEAGIRLRRRTEQSVAGRRREPPAARRRASTQTLPWPAVRRAAFQLSTMPPKNPDPALLHHRAPGLGADRDHGLGAELPGRHDGPDAAPAARTRSARKRWLGFYIPGIGALLTLLVIFLTGVFAANILGQRLVRYWERVLARIPVVNSIYNGVKQVSDTLFSPTGQAFRKALLVQWPSPGHVDDRVHDGHARRRRRRIICRATTSASTCRRRRIRPAAISSWCRAAR